MADGSMTWSEVAERLATARSYWLGTTTPSGAPHAAPVWGVVTGETLYLYTERSTVKARNLAADPRVVVHLESAEDVLIVRGVAEDLGRPAMVPSLVAALAAKYTRPEDRQYLPDADPDFNVVYALRPQSAMAWRLDDYEASQRRYPAVFRVEGQSGDRWEPSMDSAELRAVQQPLKDAYREDPEKAVVTLRAEGHLDDAISCSVETGRALAVAGLHAATGGDGSLLCSGDMLLQALVACAGVTLRAVATSLQINVTGGTVTAEGDLDFRGTLAVSKEAPVGFRSIRLAFDLDTDADVEQVQTLLRLTERYCVVYQTLAHPAELTVTA